MDSKINVLLILGTDRENSISSRAFKFLQNELNKLEEIELNIADPRELKFSYNSKDSRYTKLVEEADAFFIVTPEYNHGYPGTLKTLLDTEFGNYNRKPVAIAPVSDGVFGGARMTESLISVLKALGLVVLKKDLNFIQADKLFSENGELNDQEYMERFNVITEDLLWYAKALKNAKNNS